MTEDHIRSYFGWTLLLYVAWLVVYRYGVIRAVREREPEHPVLVFAFSSWRNYLKPVILIIWVNFLLSFIVAFAHQNYREFSVEAFVLSLLSGGLGGVLWSLFFFMTYSIGFTVIITFLEIIAAFVGKEEQQNFSAKQKLLIGHTFGVIAGSMFCMAGTLLWTLQNNLLARFSINELHSYNWGGIARFYLPAAFNGIQYGFILGYIKHIVSVRLRFKNFDERINSTLLISVFAISVLFIVIERTVKPTGNVFWLDVFYEDRDELIRWWVFCVIIVAFAWVGMKILDRTLRTEFASRYGLTDNPANTSPIVGKEQTCS